MANRSMVAKNAKAKKMLRQEYADNSKALMSALILTDKTKEHTREWMKRPAYQLRRL